MARRGSGRDREPARRRGRPDVVRFERLAPLLDALRDFPELTEPRPAEFELRAQPFLHFHHRPDGSVIADVRLAERRFIAFDVSDDAGQGEVIAAVERHLAGLREAPR